MKNLNQFVVLIEFPEQQKVSKRKSMEVIHPVGETMFLDPENGRTKRLVEAGYIKKIK